MNARIILLVALLIVVNFNGRADWIPSSGFGSNAWPVKTFVASGSNLFAGTAGNGIFYSSNNGAKWTPVNTGLTSFYISSLAVSTGGGGTKLHVGTSGGGIFGSTNNGATWTPTGVGIVNQDVWSMAANGTNVFVGTETAGIFLSTNSGVTWAHMTTGLPLGRVYALFAGESNVFAGTDDGVFRSTNNGTTWSAVNDGLEDTSIRALFLSGPNLFAGTEGGGVFLSTNYGGNWVSTNSGLPTPFHCRSLFGTDSSVFVGSYDNGAFISTNNGGEWVSINSGLTNTVVLSLYGIGSKLFAGTSNHEQVGYGGAFVSSNKGQNWSPINSGLEYPIVTTMAAAGTNLIVGTQEQGIYSSSDDGETWIETNSGLTSPFIMSSATTASSVLVGTTDGVFISTNSGGNWNSLGLDGLQISSLATRGTEFFASRINWGVYYSTNSGMSWTLQPGNGLTLPLVQCLAVVGSTLFAGTEWVHKDVSSGVFISTDNGINWVAPPFPNVHVNSIVSINNIVFAGASDFTESNNGGVYVSTNNGANWSLANVGLSNPSIRALAVSGTNLFADTPDGVFSSSNNGSSWMPVSLGLPRYRHPGLIVSGARIFAVTYSGVSTRLLAEMFTSDPSLISNHGFESGTSAWTFFTNGSGTFSTVTPGLIGTKSAKVAITTQGTNVQLMQAGISLDERSWYNLSFWAYSNSGHNFSPDIIKNTTPFTDYGLAGHEVDLSTAWGFHSLDFRTRGFAGTVNDGRLRFWIAPFDSSGDQYFIDEVRLRKLLAGTLQLHAHLSDGSGLRTNVYVITSGDTLLYDTTAVVSGVLSTPLPVGVYTVIVSVLPQEAITLASVSITEGQTTNLDVLVTPTPVAYYPFNGNANDESGNGNNATVSGAALTTDRFGIAQNAYQFNGLNNSIQAQHSPLLNVSSTRQLTFVGWIKLNSFQHQAIGFKGGAITPPYYNEWVIAIEPDNTLRFKVNANASNSSYSYLQSSPSLELNKWSQVAAVWNGATNIMKLYLNGVEVGSLTSAVSQIVSLPSEPLYLGFVGDGPLDGVLDDVSLYNLALSAQEIDSLYRIGGWPYSQEPVAYYPFNGNANDESGNGNNGTVNGAILSEDRNGLPNSAFDFDGAGAYIEVPDAPSLRPGEITIGAWVNPRTTVRKAIVYKSNYFDATNEQYALGIEAGVRTLGSIKRNSFCVPGTGWNSVASTDTIPINEWTFVCLTWDGSVLRTYVNGSIDDSSSSPPAGLIDECAGASLRFGLYWYGDPAPFDGRIDDIIIYNRAISATEVDSLYHVGGWPLSEGLVAYYPFTGNANDSSGYDNHCTIDGAVLTTDRFGNPGSAYQFDDSSSISGPAGNSLQVNEVTISAWVKLTGAGVDNPRIVAIGPATDQYEYYSIVLLGSSLSPRYMEFYKGPPPSPIDIRTNHLFETDSTWHFVAATFGGSTVQLFVDGALDTVVTSVTDVLGPYVNPTVKVGSSLNGNWLDGAVDDIRIHNYALSATEIDSLYHLNGWPLAGATSEVNLLAFDACGDSLQTTFGLALNATDCIDTLYDEQDLPPPPPSGSFDVRFILPCDSASLRDFRNDVLDEATWKLRIQACSFPITLSWDTASMPAGYMRLRDPFGGILIDVDMKNQTSLVVSNPAINELRIYLYQTNCQVLSVRNGWNMVSAPLEPQRHYLDVFSDAISTPFRYQGSSGYVADDTLDPGTGYWIKFADTASYGICGTPTVVRDIPVQVGWNIIGVFSDSITAVSITSTPSGILGSPFFFFGGTYETASVLIPGRSYWVKANQAGTIHLGPTLLPTGSAWEDYEKSLKRDASGN